MSVVERLARAGLRRGWRKGVVEGNPAWTALGGLALVVYLAGRAWRRESEVVFSEKLAPGQSLRITNLPRP